MGAATEAMLLSRQEMTFDFQGARLDPVRDREALGWMMNQFLYGEITGIQIGQWLFDVPDLESARFLARQAVEEFQHVDNFLRIMAFLGVEPAPAHRAVRFLATGMMGGSWAEHVALEMAAGEGFVLMCFYALIDTIDDPRIVEIMKRAVRQEERHVAFGERQTIRAIAGRPWLRRRLLGLNLVSLWAVRRLGAFMKRRLPPESPVLRQLPDFVRQVASAHEVRLRRLGLVDRPLEQISPLVRVALVAEAYGGKALGGLIRLITWPVRFVLRRSCPRRLTETYLEDPAIRTPALPPEDAAEAGPQ